MIILEGWKATQITDRTRILAYLETERLYAAYAIGDLEPALYAESTWAAAERAGQWRALALHFRGLQLPALFVMGHPEGVGAILDGALYPTPVYLTCRAEHLPVLQEAYAWDELIAMWRMVLRPGRFQRASGHCLRLTPQHADPLTELYEHGGGIGFSPAQIEQGVFYGILAGGCLVAVAGTHLVSETYSVAAVGNVFTHPDHRGRGYGTATTSAVVAELVERGIRDIVLNVAQGNMPAMRIYERLGFRRHCAFLEGRAWAHGSTRSDP